MSWRSVSPRSQSIRLIFLHLSLAKLVLHYTTALFVRNYEFYLAAGEDVVQRDGCLEIFSPRRSEGLELCLEAVDSLVETTQ